jgi:transcriptional regulator with XRE-family HTH domain
MHPRQEKRLAKVEPSQIRGARGMLGWSQKDLAERSGVSARTVAHVELETRVSRRDTIVQLAGALEQAGIVFGRTRHFWPQIALRPAEDPSGPLPSTSFDGEE